MTSHSNLGLLLRMSIADVRGASPKEQAMVLGLFEEARQEIVTLRAELRLAQREIDELKKLLHEALQEIAKLARCHVQPHAED